MTYSKNMPILYRNVMDGLPSDFPREVFLWAVERPGEDPNCYRAEKFAREAESLFQAVKHLISLNQYCRFKGAAKGIHTHLMNEEQRDSLLQFILKRHANWRYGGNVTPAYGVAA